MKRPRARAGRTPISSRVRIVDAPAAVGVGGGEPWNTGGGAGADTTFIDVVSGPLDVVAGRGRTATPPDAGVEEITPAAAATPAARRCGRRAICASSSRTDWGRWPGSLASTLVSSWSSSSGRLAFSLTADGIGELTVAYATSIRFVPAKGSLPVSISKVRTPIA